MRFNEMRKVYFGPGLDLHGPKIRDNGRLYLDKSRRTKQDRYKRSGLIEHSSYVVLKGLLIKAKDLIRVFVEAVTHTYKTDGERRLFYKNLVNKAGYGDLLADNAETKRTERYVSPAVLQVEIPDFKSWPPRKWHDKDADESLESFVASEYGRWIGKGLVQADIRRQDIHLYYALVNWKNRTGGSISDDLGIPSKKEMTERILQDNSGINTSFVEAASRWQQRIRSRERRAQVKPKIDR